MAKAQPTAITSLIINRILITKTQNSLWLSRRCLIEQIPFYRLLGLINPVYHQVNTRLLKAILPY